MGLLDISFKDIKQACNDKCLCNPRLISTHLSDYCVYYLYINNDIDLLKNDIEEYIQYHQLHNLSINAVIPYSYGILDNHLIYPFFNELVHLYTSINCSLYFHFIFEVMQDYYDLVNNECVVKKLVSIIDDEVMNVDDIQSINKTINDYDLTKQLLILNPLCKDDIYFSELTEQKLYEYIMQNNNFPLKKIINVFHKYRPNIEQLILTQEAKNFIKKV